MDNRLRTGLIVAGGVLGAVLLSAAAGGPAPGLDTAVRYIFSEQQKQMLDLLHPDYRERFRAFVAEIEQKLGYNVIISSSYRTFQSQEKLHQENSSNALPGRSMHNYGLAIDINLQKGQVLLRKASSNQEWINSGVVKLAEKYGLTWGGTFKTYQGGDPVHFGLDHKIDMNAIYNQAIKQFGSIENVIGNQVILPKPLLRAA